MKKLFSGFTLVLLAYMSHGDEIQDSTAEATFVLCETDMEGLEIISRASREATDTKRFSVYHPWVEQDAKLNDIQFRVGYSKFPTVEQAEQAVNFYIHDVSAIFARGVWDDAIQQKVGDNSWYSEKNGWGNSILIISGTTCIQVSCLEGEEATRKHICEQVALKVVEKIEYGSRVIVSNEVPMTSEEYLSTVASETQQSRTENKSVEEQSPQTDDIVTLPPPVIVETKNVAVGKQLDLRFYIGVTLFLCLCAIAYFVRKKIKQRSTSRLRK